MCARELAEILAPSSGSADVEQKSQHGVTSTEGTLAQRDTEVGAKAGGGLAGLGRCNTGIAKSLGALCEGEVAAEDAGCPGKSSLHPGLLPGRDLQPQGPV